MSTPFVHRWYCHIMPEHDPIPIPLVQPFDSLADACFLAMMTVERNRPEDIHHIKVYKWDNEADVRLRWDRERGYHDLSRTARDVLAQHGVDALASGEKCPRCHGTGKDPAGFGSPDPWVCMTCGGDALASGVEGDDGTEGKQP